MKKVKIGFTAEHTNGNLISLINLWELDRGAEGCERVFDLEKLCDFMDFARIYSLNGAITCKSISQYWWGGMNFIWNDDSFVKKNWDACGIVKPCELSEKTYTWILGEIEDIVQNDIDSGKCGIRETENFYFNMLKIVVEDITTKMITEQCPFKHNKIKDITKTESKYGLDYYYITFENGEYYCAISNGDKIYFPTTDCYPADINEIRTYQWRDMNNTNDILMFDKTFALRKISDTTLSRLININISVAINGKSCDGIMLNFATETNIGFYSLLHKGDYIACYDNEFSPMPRAIGVCCAFVTY